eukprot:5158053-Prymnesium_polylepis.1
MRCSYWLMRCGQGSRAHASQWWRGRRGGGTAQAGRGLHVLAVRFVVRRGGRARGERARGHGGGQAA